MQEKETKEIVIGALSAIAQAMISAGETAQKFESGSVVVTGVTGDGDKPLFTAEEIREKVLEIVADDGFRKLKMYSMVRVKLTVLGAEILQKHLDYASIKLSRPGMRTTANRIQLYIEYDKEGFTKIPFRTLFHLTKENEPESVFDVDTMQIQTKS